MKSIKRAGVGQGKAKLHKFITEVPPGQVFLQEENTLLCLNHLINYHYLINAIAFGQRGQLTLGEDPMFAFTVYQ